MNQHYVKQYEMTENNQDIMATKGNESGTTITYTATLYGDRTKSIFLLCNYHDMLFQSPLHLAYLVMP